MKPFCSIFIILTFSVFSSVTSKYRVITSYEKYARCVDYVYQDYKMTCPSGPNCLFKSKIVDADQTYLILHFQNVSITCKCPDISAYAINGRLTKAECFNSYTKSYIDIK
ncbi:hypothetical protein A3Q56_07721 [Intoshia linei]|uniref:Uncharacterized protein n=1 Tax=Intoshia linei TaxID=1819745 RepID=A0A177ATK7_9BILA|nr:hypothetical protein A3Q56_07721 [Intoshia linei]